MAKVFNENRNYKIEYRADSGNHFLLYFKDLRKNYKFTKNFNKNININNIRNKILNNEYFNITICTGLDFYNKILVYNDDGIKIKYNNDNDNDIYHYNDNEYNLTYCDLNEFLKVIEEHQ